MENGFSLFNSALYWAVVVAAAVFEIAVVWKVYKKAGRPGWAAIIPVYNTIVLLRIVRRPVWWIILLIIPFVNVIFMIIVLHALARIFGKGAGYTAGLILAPVVFYPLLAFGKAEYESFNIEKN